ncbi:hypothetical protein F511_24826 [Dorcoceras hygrometricum]|uniref:HTH myb-type domain-containing protein n=1 Tax=Dorcoceras hygrometricum TaxID=472368 RepID=A0A2Z7C0P6_9LAMI|nr:hypothetical protein F511_24826 [Dorcoceras hygrometricum]
MGMGSRICPELSLDCPSSSRYLVQKPIWKFLKEVSGIRSVPEKISKLHEYVDRLQDEMKKIYSFKRELPFCMLLLNDAIVMMEDELIKFRGSSTQPLLKEFIPLKKDEEVESVKENTLTNFNDEKSWKNSLQLGNLNNVHHFQNSGFDCIKHMLKPDKSRKRAKEKMNNPLEIKVKEEDNESSLGSNLKALERQTTKKQRRSWSPELHHRFVEALLKLGGARAATPRLIRENMAVEGLTLDQVKSHLQKYRMHTKKSTPTSVQPIGVGDSRLPQEPHGILGSSQSRSPHGLTGSSHGTSTTTGGDTIIEEDDERSEIHSWRSRLQRCVV